MLLSSRVFVESVRIWGSSVRWLLVQLGLAVAVSCAVVNSYAAVGDAMVFSPDHRFDEYAPARGRAQAWLDSLDVDVADLDGRGIKAKKKLAESLDAYWVLLRTASDDEKPALRQRLEQLVRQTETPAYHDMETCSDEEFDENSMSYLRVMWLLDQLGFDTQDYRQRIAGIQARLDGHLARRGPWQQQMFRRYYAWLDLPRPRFEFTGTESATVLARRVPSYRLDQSVLATDQAQVPHKDAYDLAHDVLVAFGYGTLREPSISEESIAYLRQTLPLLVYRHSRDTNIDILAELLLSMTFLGLQSDPAYIEGIDVLLDAQNPNGSWGDYEQFRANWGEYLNVRIYLHTTLVSLWALTEAYRGDWAVRE